MSNDFFQYDDTGPAPPPPAAATRPAGAPIRLLAELEDEDWVQLIGFMSRRRHPAASAVLRAGDRDPALLFVASGQVDVAVPGTAPSRRGEGEVIGVLSFLDGAPQAATVTAVGEVELLRLTPDALGRLAAWQPRIAVALLRDLGAHVGGQLRALQAAD